MRARWLGCGCLFFFLLLCSYGIRAESFFQDASVRIDDPWEHWNRRVFYFNEKLDCYLIKPAAQAYTRVIPNEIERGIGRFFNNLAEPTTLVNQLLQAKWVPATHTGGRFVINSTVGVLGLIDVAARVGLDSYDEDFGQTLGYWGVGSGPYLVLPLLGPSSLRDTAGLIPKYAITDPVNHLAPDSLAYGLYGLNIIQSRAQLLNVDGVAPGDHYSFVRDAYLQRRTFLIQDGQVEDAFLNE